MHRLILACLGVLLAGADPAPAPAPKSKPKPAEVYTLRFEEKGVDIERPVPAGQKPVDLSKEEDKLILTTDVDVTPGQPFRVRMKQGKQIRIVAGKPAAEWNDKGKLPVEIRYGVLQENPGGPPDQTTARTTLGMSLGEPVQVGNIISSGTSTRPDGESQHYRRLIVSVTLMEKTKDELEE